MGHHSKHKHHHDRRDKPELLTAIIGDVVNLCLQQEMAVTLHKFHTTHHHLEAELEISKEGDLLPFDKTRTQHLKDLLQIYLSIGYQCSTRHAPKLEIKGKSIKVKLHF